MRDSISLGEYLYHALRTRITSGLLEAGSPFLSIQQLREEYQVGFRTAREVTQRLQEEGLIAVRPRHTPTIAYSLTGAARQTALAQAAAQRDALLEVCDTLTLVLPLFLSGAGGIPPAVPPAQWEEMTRAVGRGLEAGEWRTLVQRFAQALRTTGTPLFHSVFIALLSSSRPGLFLGEGRAYTAFSQRIRQVLTGAMACNLPQEGQSLRAVLHSYRELVERSLPPQTAPGCTGPLFLWQLPHLPDYRYRRLVHHLLQDISSGRYPPGSFLPHEGALARSHGLSVSTVRRAMALLRELGFCRTLNARGTQVIPRDQAEAIPALSAPSARQMVYTALQANQLLLLLLESITHLSLPQCDPDRPGRPLPRPDPGGAGHAPHHPAAAGASAPVPPAPHRHPAVSRRAMGQLPLPAPGHPPGPPPRPRPQRPVHRGLPLPGTGPVRPLPPHSPAYPPAGCTAPFPRRNLSAHRVCQRPPAVSPTAGGLVSSVPCTRNHPLQGFSWATLLSPIT